MADTNKMLQFKMGEWTESFDSMAKSPGTVYITTNEKAMYVDVDNDTRIRIGDIIQVESARVAKPPFSTDALYYFIEENALLKWGKFGVDADGNPNGTMAWKQLNSVSDITTNLNNLTQRVTTAEGQITALETTLGTTNDTTGTTAFGRIKVLEGKMTTAEGEIDALQTLTTNQGTAIANLQKAVGNGAEGLASKVTSLEGRMDTAESGITAINGIIGTEAAEGKDATGLYAYIDQAEADAITTAAGDATSKANKAFEDAKSYAD
jgi:hypothetical protein